MSPNSLNRIKSLRYSLQKRNIGYKYPKLSFPISLDDSSELIRGMILGDKPFMIARMGNNELNAVCTYLSSQKRHSALRYILGRQDAWWWDEGLIREMNINAGFFPATQSSLEKFSQLILDDITHVDVLLSWLPKELNLTPYLKQDCKRVRLTHIDPYWNEIPWSAALKGKRVLVVHPFKESILRQYDRRERLFSNPDILPEFSNLEVIQAVQSIGGDNNGFSSWFEALDFMKEEIDKHDYDICLIGCGAYGLPLAAHVKRQGHKSIHIGGSLQLLFGIKGDRWANWKPCQRDGRTVSYADLPNEYWISPSSEERPKAFKQVEGGCYWQYTSDMKQCVITIPVYKSEISTFEEISLRQCYKVLGKYPICIVTHDSVDLARYESIATEYEVSLLREDFAPAFFDGVKGYNNLCLSLDLYKRFEAYDYMLIYQLDAYVFRDELNEWCDKGYDYIGAPWFENWGAHEEGCALWKVGNGGLSLRRVAWFTRFLSCKRLYGWKELKGRYYKGTLKSWLVCVWHLLGRAQSIDFFLKEFHSNEDWVYCNGAMLTRLKPNVPDCETAAHFSFERSPSYLYTLTNGLPFGCHAWEKYEYDTFWKQYIPAS